MSRAARELDGVTDDANRLMIGGEIAQTWARLGNIGEFQATLQKLEQFDQANGSKGPPAVDMYRFGGLNQLIPVLVRKGQATEALKLCDDLPAKYQASAKQLVAQSLAEQGKLAEARAIAGQFTGIEADNIQIGIAMGLAKAGLTAEVLEAAKSVREPLRNTVYNALVLAQARQGDDAAARQTIQNAPAAARESAWVSLYSEQLRRGDFAAAKESLRAIPSAERRERNYLDYCFALVRNGRLEEAKATALEMVGQSQELPAFNLVSVQLIQRGDEAGAATFRQKMSPKLRERAAKDLRYYMVFAAANAGDTARAVRNLEALPAAERTFNVYMTVAAALAKAQDNEQARRYVALAQAAATAENPDRPPLRATQPLAFEMAKAGDIEAALQLAQGLAADQGRDAVLGVVANGCMENGQFERALSIIQSITDDQARYTAARRLGYSAANREQWGELTAWVDALPSAKDRAGACVSIAQACLALTPEMPSTEPVGTGDGFRVFRPIDTTRPGFYATGSWTYSYEMSGDTDGRGILRYIGHDLPEPQPGDYIVTPWGWMQWQEKTLWQPVAEKPATGKELSAPGQ